MPTFGRDRIAYIVIYVNSDRVFFVALVFNVDETIDKFCRVACPWKSIPGARPAGETDQIIARLALSFLDLSKRPGLVLKKFAVNHG